MNDDKTYSIVIWFEYFELWRINRKIKTMFLDGYELIDVVPPGFPGPQKLSLKFSKVSKPRMCQAHFKAFWRKINIPYDWSFKETLGSFYISKQ